MADTRPTFSVRLDAMPARVMEVENHRLVLFADDPDALRKWAYGLMLDVDRYLADREREPVPGQTRAFG